MDARPTARVGRHHQRVEVGHRTMVLLTVNVVVHPVTELSHPGAGGWWRWAVHIGHDWLDRASCLQAGLEPDRVEALKRGQACAVAASRIARVCDAFIGGTTYELEHDV